MSKNYSLAIFLGFTLLLLVLTPLSAATTPLTVPNLNEITVTSIGLGETVDPAWAYDTASAELIRQVYDTR